MFKATLAGWMAVDVAPLAGFAAAEAAPVVITSFLGNPVVWTETGGSLILGAHGYEGEFNSGAVRGSNRAFWSGKGTEARALADGFEVLGKTRAGKNLIELTKDMPYYPAIDGKPASQAYEMWARLSVAYAKGARGEVHVYQTAEIMLPNTSIWRLYEYPTLLANPNVTKIVYHH